jgi:hypothetical protein
VAFFTVNDIHSAAAEDYVIAKTAMNDRSA